MLIAIVFSLAIYFSLSSILSLLLITLCSINTWIRMIHTHTYAQLNDDKHNGFWNIFFASVFWGLFYYLKH